MLTSRRFMICALAFTLAVWAAFLLFPNAFVQLTLEDGPIESAGAAALLTAGIAFLVCGVRAFKRRARWTAGVWFLGLAMLFMLALGEELSWGQRIFNWDAPEAFASQNTQRETNLHNLRFVHCQECEGTLIHRSASGVPIIDAGRLFAMIILGLSFLLPLGYRFVRPFRRLVNWAAVPVPPLWPGVIAFGALIGSRVAMLVHTSSAPGYSARELMEALMAFTVAAVAVIELRRSAPARKAPQPESRRATTGARTVPR